jgi:hypothetical protein
MRGLARLTTLATLVAVLAGCGAPAPSATPGASAVEGDVEAGVVVVNRSQQPIAPVVGFVTPGCGERFYDPATAHVISDKMMAWGRGEVEDPAPPVGRLDAWFVPPSGRWFILVTSTDDPQIFFQGPVPSDLLAQLPTAKPRPDVWPPCVGQAKLG